MLPQLVQVARRPRRRTFTIAIVIFNLRGVPEEVLYLQFGVAL
jgi:hypothetical protein